MTTHTAPPVAPPARKPLTTPTHRKGSGWVYEGVWAVLVKLLRVPPLPPELPGVLKVAALRPADGYLNYQKLVFWLTAWFPPIVAIVIIALVAIPAPIVAVLIAVPLLIFFTAPLVVAFVALHVKFDSTWYVLSDRSIRLRRGIITILETTITYENIQNVTVEQGPIQRLFGISDLRISTAGGGGGSPHGESASMHVGRLEGIDAPQEIRELIMDRVRASRSAGLGDEARHDPSPALPSPALPSTHAFTPAWTPAHIEALRDIRAVLAVRATNPH
jgi:membrane protein YdbS with pleckstrin-like domain